MDLSCKDWAERLQNGHSLMPHLDLPNPELAQKAIGFFENLRIPDVPNQPFLKEACGNWFKEIVGAIFGSLDPTTKDRLIREIFVLVPKKNSKTTYAAALMLVAVLLSERPNAEFLIVAPTKEVANIALSQARGMILADEYLKQNFRIQDHLKTLTYLPTNAKLMIKAFAANVMTGVKPSGILVDEQHVISLAADAENVMAQLRGGMISQPEAFLMTITTQSTKPPRGVFKNDLNAARAVRDGERAGTGLLPIIYEFPSEIQKPALLPGQKAPWENPEYWRMVLPNLGRSIQVNRLIQDFETVSEKGIEERNLWASQHLNIQIGQALRSDRWVGADFFQKQIDPHLTLEALLKRSDAVVAGIDGGGLDDLLSLAILGRDKASQDWLAWSKSWVFEGVLELRKKEASQLRDFQQQGDLVIISEPGQDIEELSDLLAETDQQLPLSMVGLDPVGVGAIIDALSQKGIGNDRVVGISQGWALTGAIKTTERKLADESLFHAPQEIVSWAVSNAKVSPRGNAIIITKQESGYLKIDPLMALFNAVSLMSKNPTAVTKKGTVNDFLQCGILSLPA